MHITANNNNSKGNECDCDVIPKHLYKILKEIFPLNFVMVPTGPYYCIGSTVVPPIVNYGPLSTPKWIQFNLFNEFLSMEVNFII